MYDPKDSRGVPISSGIPPVVIISSFVGLAMIIVMMALVIFASGANHRWPSSTTVKEPLGAAGPVRIRA